VNDWGQYQETLKALYGKCGCTAVLERDSSYLHDAYLNVERLWQGAVKNLDSVRLIILGEAPLWGENKAYVYNPAVGTSSFFGYTAAVDLVGELTFSKRPTGGVIPKKAQMISKLTAAGVVIVDLFPFCFNQRDTALQYPKLARKNVYRWLFTETMRHHFLPKIAQLESTGSNRPKIAFRYARSEGQLRHLVKNVLLPKNLVTDDGLIPSIHSGRNLDRPKLKGLFMASDIA